MNLLLQALKMYVPGRLMRRKLLELFEATASACGAGLPDLTGRSMADCLERYAEYSRELIGRKISNGEAMEDVRLALYWHAYNLGSDLRRQLHLRSTDDVYAVGRILYRAIGIDFSGEGGRVVIRRCYFSRFYDAAICQIMSALDEGIAAGLSGGGRLTFTRRITEGQTSCEAQFDLSGSVL